jgi:membrane protein insertase Oxa1/YidC/SpoIIIJ
LPWGNSGLYFMKIFILLTILFALVAIVVTVLYIRAMKKMQEVSGELKECRNNNKDFIKTLSELTRENIRLHAILNNKNNSK